MYATTVRHLLLPLLLTFSALLHAQNGAIDQPFGFKSLPDATETRCVRTFSNGNVLVCGNKSDAAGNGFYSNISMYDRYGQLLSSYTNRLAAMAYVCDTLPNGQGIAIATNIDTPSQLIFMTTDSAFVDYHTNTAAGITSIDVYGMKALQGGALIVCGRASIGGLSAMFVSRYHPLISGGELLGIASDLTLEERTYIFGTDAQARAIDVQSDGSYIIAGHEIAPQAEGMVIRMLGDGTIDGTFNSNNGPIVQTSPQSGGYYENYALSVDAQDNIYASGRVDGYSMVACYSPAGAVRYTRYNYQGQQGVYTSTARGGYLFAGGLDQFYGVSANSLTGAMLLRTTTGVPFDVDTTFHPFSGAQYVSFYTLNAIFSSCFQADGRLLVCGTLDNHGFVARLGSAATGLTETADAIDCTLYPVPAAGTLHLRTTERLNSISVCTLTGQQVLAADGTATSLDLSTLPDGPYLIGLTTTDGRTSHRLITHTSVR